MAQYEITYISDGEIAEEARAQLDAEVDGAIRDLGGSASFSSPHTPRRLFYPVAGKRTAGMRALQVELESSQVEELKTFFKKHAGLLRFSILNTPRRSEVPATILDQLRGSKGRPTPAPVTSKAAPAKPVTMEEVEKGIEKALEEEVK